MHDHDNGTIELRSLAEWQQHLTAQAEKLHRQDRLLADLSTRTQRTFPAKCSMCDRQKPFVLPPAGEYGSVDFRETLVCPDCRLNARMRAALSLLMDFGLPDTAAIYVTEQASYTYVWLKQHYPMTRGSEYRLDATLGAQLVHWLAELGVPGPIADEDIMALSLGNADLDAIVSFDVLEHVPDYRAALREFARCLKPGGQLLLTIPFLDNSEATITRARLRPDGSIEHVLPPEIHGDPISGGALCFFLFGWSLLDDIRLAGFSDACWCRTWDTEHAAFGLWTLRAVR